MLRRLALIFALFFTLGIASCEREQEVEGEEEEQGQGGGCAMCKWDPNR
ncbi:MAG: hypothetical protein ACI857_000357 [Arenicella sp.]|jgi:hypothetical protein